MYEVSHFTVDFFVPNDSVLLSALIFTRGGVQCSLGAVMM